MPFRRNFKELNKKLLKESGDAILGDNFDRKTKNSTNTIILKLRDYFIENWIPNDFEFEENLGDAKF